MASADDIDRWDAVAGEYAARVGGEDDSFYRRLAPFLWQQLGRLESRRVLDLGCGHGWLAGKLAEAGAEVVGVDGSGSLIAAARRAYPGIEFTVADLADGLPQGLGAFDAVVSHMVLMDIPVIDRLLGDVSRALSPSGIFVFSILHPCFFGQSPERDPQTGEWYRRVTGYLAHEQRWIESFGGHNHYHRPLSWYVRQLTGHGLSVTALHEPPTLPQDPKPADAWDDYERWFSTIPTMLAMACRPAFTVGS